ncbi:TIGR00730 family Rossman fold protein [Alteribacillus sp. HJP-4]|uniref:LOG family protein n=1 Tax=Alteribacillus sp. HJP-4 TaxID=2775394 RepID=UPI0035CCDAB1
MRSLTIFCGSSKGFNEEYEKQAVLLGQLAARHDIEIIYGGSSSGLMGTLADSVLRNGGKVTGIIPESLMSKEAAHQHLNNLITVKTMHERKALMYEKGEAFVAMPGGIGTLEEFIEILTWGAIGHHKKTCGLFNVNQYYRPLSDLFEHMVNEGFLAEHIAEQIITEEEPGLLLEKLGMYEPEKQ